MLPVPVGRCTAAVTNLNIIMMASGIGSIHNALMDDQPLSHAVTVLRQHDCARDSISGQTHCGCDRDRLHICMSPRHSPGQQGP